MNYFSKNLKYLRSQKGKFHTQDDVADALGLPRSTINSYENGSIKNPTLKALMQFSAYYRILINTLIDTDLCMLNYVQLQGHRTMYDALSILPEKQLAKSQA